MPLTDLKEDKVINVRPSINVVSASKDAAARSAVALVTHATFFNSRTHKNKVKAVLGIVNSFFVERKEIYINRRIGKGRPFTVIKVERPMFPALSYKKIDELYRKPLEALGVERVFSKGTNSYLFRIY